MRRSGVQITEAAPYVAKQRHMLPLGFGRSEATGARPGGCPSLPLGVVHRARDGQGAATARAGALQVPAGDVVVLEHGVNHEDGAPAVQALVRRDAALIDEANSWAVR